MAVPFTQAYRGIDFGPIRESSNSPEFIQLCDAVRQRTGAHDVLIYYRARALSLYTGRRTSTYNYNGTQAEFWKWGQRIGATYVITTNAFHGDGRFLDQVVNRYSNRLELAYRNAHFSLYRIRSLDDASDASISR